MFSGEEEKIMPKEMILRFNSYLKTTQKQF
jgi:hypothetical protein